jgi:hypothetical protein
VYYVERSTQVFLPPHAIPGTKGGAESILGERLADLSLVSRWKRLFGVFRGLRAESHPKQGVDQDGEPDPNGICHPWLGGVGPNEYQSVRPVATSATSQISTSMSGDSHLDAVRFRRGLMATTCPV